MLGRALTRVPEPLWIVLAVLAVAWPLLGLHFVADDLRVLRWYTEPLGTDALTVHWSTVLADFVGPWGGNQNLPFYRPMVSTSLALDFAVFGANPAATAAINTLIHLLSALVLWRLARWILPGKRAALPAALLFALTPLAHENLAWAVGRCGLTVLLGLLSGWTFVRGYERNRGVRRYALPCALAALNLMTMESALGWLAFPAVALWMRYAVGKAMMPRAGLRVVAPFAVLGLVYLGLRWACLGSVTGGHATAILGGSFATLAARPLHLLYQALVPRDVTWIPPGAASSVFRALCLFPVVLGLAAPLYIRDPRSRAYRRVLGLLLGFWLLTRLPSLMILDLGADLEGSRTAYYSYAPLALAIGLLAATVRYARWAAFLLAITFGLGLRHRLMRRVAWAQAGVTACSLLVDEARQAGALGDQAKHALCILSELDGEGGAPAYYPGEIVYALYPPLTSERVQAITVHQFAKIGEPAAGLWIAHALGGLHHISEPSGPHGEVRVATPDVDALLGPPLPALPWQPRLGPPGPGGFGALLDISEPAPGTILQLFLAAGPDNLSVPLRGDGWPAQARERLEEWARLAGGRAPFAFFLESRGPTGKALARSAVVLGWTADR